MAAATIIVFLLFLTTNRYILNLRQPNYKMILDEQRYYNKVL
jgi:hypothetical protein